MFVRLKLVSCEISVQREPVRACGSASLAIAAPDTEKPTAQQPDNAFPSHAALFCVLLPHSLTHALQKELEKQKMIDTINERNRRMDIENAELLRRTQLEDGAYGKCIFPRACETIENGDQDRRDGTVGGAKRDGDETQGKRTREKERERE